MSSIRYLLGRLLSGWGAGGATVELALVSPLLIIILVGATDYGVFAYQQSALVAAARSSAEYGRANLPDVGTTTDISGSYFAWPLLLPSGATKTLTATRVCACRNGGTPPGSSPTQANCSASPPACSGSDLMQYVEVTATVGNYSPLLASSIGFTSFLLPNKLYATAFYRAQ